jgi:predicted secreted hydrolase
MVPERKYDIQHLGTFTDEWIAHSKSQDWWYCTGFLTDEEGKLYSYQFTILRLYFLGIHPYLLMLALTDYTTGEHIYYQDISLNANKLTLTSDSVAFGDVAKVILEKDTMELTVHHKRFDLGLSLVYGKGAVWHCDNGLLEMGFHAKGNTTQDYTYPNMPTKGTLQLDGTTYTVSGKTWFDKQYGSFRPLNPKTHWEWFSLRFDDNEEIMLFSFPQDDYRDGTYIKQDGNYARLNNYTIEPTKFAFPDGTTKYSCEWSITIPGLKEERYTLMPMLEGQMNLGYYELLADIRNTKGEKVGMAFVELLPGARNKSFKNVLFTKKK